MARFSKGTTDHDGDGRMGGSRKGDTSMAKSPSKRTTTRTATRPTSAKAAEDRAAIEAARTDMATAMDPQSGMDIVHDEKPTIAAVKKQQREAAEQFAEADAKGDPDVAEATLSRQIRGY